MYDIPAKIHSEIFGDNARSVVNLANFDKQSYMVSPLQTQKRSLDRIPLATELFAPAVVKFPAATKGQVEAYMKALEEEAKEAEKEMQTRTLMGTQLMLDRERRIIDPNPVSYVNVKLG
ncbi:hypothetical protein Trydic_g23052, partial [Trypoxylus dichotomus]